MCCCSFLLVDTDEKRPCLFFCRSVLMMIWLQSTLLITRKLKGLQGVLQMILMMKCPWMLSVFQWSLLVLHFLPGQNCPLGRRCHHIVSQVRPTSVGDSPACSTLCFVACVEWEFPASVWILVTGTRGVHLWLSCVQMIRNGNLHFVYLFRSCWL